MWYVGSLGAKKYQSLFTLQPLFNPISTFHRPPLENEAEGHLDLPVWIRRGENLPRGTRWDTG
jgi:hypothetical protein